MIIESLKATLNLLFLLSLNLLRGGLSDSLLIQSLKRLPDGQDFISDGRMLSLIEMVPIWKDPTVQYHSNKFKLLPARHEYCMKKIASYKMVRAFFQTPH